MLVLIGVALFSFVCGMLCGATMTEPEDDYDRLESEPVDTDPEGL